MLYELVTKQTFMNQLRALPPKYMAQILEKVEVLRDDPAPHGDLKKKLEGVKGNLYRLRSGTYRILYTYGDGLVTLIGVDDRKDVYKGDHLYADFPTITADQIPDTADLLTPSEPAHAWAAHSVAPESEKQPLPTPIDLELLERLLIPAVYQKALLACRTSDDIYNADIPDSVRMAVLDAITTPNYERVLTHQPDYIVPEVNDLLRYKEGELLGFLLRLSPAQEKFVTWGLGANGPTLVKGGPGTGKSMVALYRVRELIRVLHGAGIARPRILFTTYTNALVIYSRQLLQMLLGDDVDCVEVSTYDKIVRDIYKAGHGDPQMAKDTDQRKALARAIETVEYDGNPLQKKAQQAAIDRMGEAYLLEELNTVITARQLDTLEAYQATPRPGRKVAFNATQRMAVWAVYQQYVAALAGMGKITFQQMRAAAETWARTGLWAEQYDAIIVDEAQDLDPSVLRLLIGLCHAPNHFFLTADANQSIYGAGFKWSEVHDDLKFRGHTGVLYVNFRSTREIGDAAAAYLAGRELDTEDMPSIEYVHEGPQPAVRSVATGADECDLLRAFLPEAARMFQLGRGACAVLVPSADAGRALAAELTSRGLKATFMPGADLDLSSRNVKVVTLQSAKGLEFPIVALAGFHNTIYPRRTAGMHDEEWEEQLARERRTMYVGMTRAMRALLVCAPVNTTSPLLTGFSPIYWNCGVAATERS